MSRICRCMNMIRHMKIRYLIVYGLVFIFVLSIGSFLFNRRSNLLELISRQVLPDIDKQACVHPKLDPWTESMMKHFYHIPTPKCGEEEEWITIDNGSARLNPIIVTKHGDVTCSLSYLKRIDDFENKWVDTVYLAGDDKIPLKDDFFKAECKSLTDRSSYENVYAGVAYKKDLHEPFRANPNGMNLNVLMIGFDSISHMTFIRKLPKTYEYFTSKLKGLVLNGYNIVGDGTPQAFIPLLTGKTELELPVVLKRFERKDYVDVYPMIWKKYKSQGYITSFAEDYPQAGMFTTRFTGFNKQPTDHYMRPYYIATAKNVILKFGMRVLTRDYDLCIGNRRKSQIFSDYIRHLYKMYPNKPKFSISFLGDMSHLDHNLVETADVDVLELLQEFEETGKLNNTVLIVMSDHGARYNKVRAELQGKHEERLPFFGFAFPPWFKEKYPLAYKHFKQNTDRLSTPFDVHATLNSILEFDEIKMGDNSNERGISLFQEIPKWRTCKHADIPAHWCACLNWYAASPHDLNIQKAALHVVSSINDYISHNKQCSSLHLYNITRALQFLPDISLVKFSGAADADGFKPKMSDETQVDSMMYQVWFFTAPSMGFFEATVKYNIQTKKFGVNMTDVSRINKYGHDADCDSGHGKDIRKFCYCNKS